MVWYGMVWYLCGVVENGIAGGHHYFLDGHVLQTRILLDETVDVTDICTKKKKKKKGHERTEGLSFPWKEGTCTGT